MVLESVGLWHQRSFRGMEVEAAAAAAEMVEEEVVVVVADAEPEKSTSL